MLTLDRVNNINLFPPASASFQGRNKVYGTRDQRLIWGWDQGSQLREWDHNPWDRDQQCFVESGIKIRNVFGIRDQNFRAEIRDQLWKNIPRYDPVIQS